MKIIHKRLGGKEMKDENKKKLPVDIYLIAGLVMYWAYMIMKHYVTEVSDIIAYPWMIVSCIIMLVGVFRTGKLLGEFFKKR